MKENGQEKMHKSLQGNKNMRKMGKQGYLAFHQ